MHDTALRIGCLAMDTYASSDTAQILEIGASDINGSLRDHAVSTVRYTGVDFAAGPGVDIVIEPNAPLPVPDDGFDLVIASSVLEHDPAFWVTFLEMCRKARPGGYVYINVPSNGEIHRYPSDNWRFYPDSGRALANWAVSQGLEIALVESFVAARENDRWNDFVAVFRKGDATAPLPGPLLHQQVAGTNVWIGDDAEPLRPSSQTEDMALIDEAQGQLLVLRDSLDRSEQQIGFLLAARATFEEQSVLDRRHIADLDQTLLERQAAVADIGRDLAEAQSQVADLRGSSSQLEQRILDLEAERSAQDGRSEQDRRRIADLDETLLERQAAMRRIEQDLAEARGQVADLRDSSSQLEQRIRDLDAVRLAQDAQSRLDRHRIADLDSTLLQRQEEIAQTIASLDEARDRVAALSAEATRLAEREAMLVEKLGVESAWVFRLAGERRAAESDAQAARDEQMRTERRLQSALARIDELDHRLVLMQQTVHDARAEARRDAETIAIMRTDGEAALAAERARVDQLAADRDTAIAIVRTESDAALAAERRRSDHMLAERTEAAGAELEKAKSDWASRIDERFGETAMLTRLLRDEEDARRRDAMNMDWLRRIHAEIAAQPWWWGLLPSRMRRRMTDKRLLRRRLFDGDAYLAGYPDVAAAGMDALQHYIHHGMSEGRSLPDLSPSR